MCLFLDVIEKISERSAEPALSLERETYLRQEVKVLSLDGLAHLPSLREISYGNGRLPDLRQHEPEDG